eukprot:4610-Eustigmatos_ZCMA.PRE.1
MTSTDPGDRRRKPQVHQVELCMRALCCSVVQSAVRQPVGADPSDGALPEFGARGRGGKGRGRARLLH